MSFPATARCLLVVMVAACSGKEAPPDAAPPPAPSKAVTDLLPTTPGLPLPVKGLRFDMDRAATLQAVPALAAGDALILPKHPEVELRVAFRKGPERLRYVSLIAPLTAVNPILSRWGTPKRRKLSSRRDVEVWLVPEIQVQVVLERSPDTLRLVFRPYTPWKDLLGGPAKGVGAATPGFGFETTPILGRSRGEILKLYPGARPRGERVNLRLPRTEHAEEPTLVRIGLVEDRATSIELRLEYRGRPGLRQAYLDAITGKWGTSAESEGARRTYAGGRVVVDDDPRAGRVRILVTEAPAPESATEPTPKP